MLKQYQEAVQLCYSGESFVQSSGKLRITTQHGEMTATCVFEIRQKGFTHDANMENIDFDEHVFEPDCHVTLKDFTPAVGKKSKQGDDAMLIMTGAGTPRCPVKNYLGNADCNGQSKARSATSNILSL